MAAQVVEDVRASCPRAIALQLGLLASTYTVHNTCVYRQAEAQTAESSRACQRMASRRGRLSVRSMGCVSRYDGREGEEDRRPGTGYCYMETSARQQVGREAVQVFRAATSSWDGAVGTTGSGPGWMRRGAGLGNRMSEIFPNSMALPLSRPSRAPNPARYRLYIDVCMYVCTPTTVHCARCSTTPSPLAAISAAPVCGLATHLRDTAHQVCRCSDEFPLVEFPLVFESRPVTIPHMPKRPVTMM